MKSGTPVVADTLANLDCVVCMRMLPAITPSLLVRCKKLASPKALPLLYFRGRYGACRERQERLALKAHRQLARRMR